MAMAASLRGLLLGLGLRSSISAVYAIRRATVNETVKGKRIHVSLILLRVSFSIIFCMNLRRIANRVVFTAITLLDMPKPHRRTYPHTSGVLV